MVFYIAVAFTCKRFTLRFLRAAVYLVMQGPKHNKTSPIALSCGQHALQLSYVSFLKREVRNNLHASLDPSF